MNPTTKKLIKTAKPYQGLFFFTLFCMLFSGLASVLPSWFVKIAVDGITALEHGLKTFSIIPKQVEPYIPQWLANSNLVNLDSGNLHIVLPLAIVAVFAIEAVLKFFFQYNSRKLGLLIVKRLREEFHNHLSLLSLARQRKFDSGSLISVISSDLNSLQSWLAESIMNLFNESIVALFLFAWLLILDVKLTLLSLVTIPLFAIPVVKLGKGIRNYSKLGQDYVGTMSSFVSETLRNQTIIKAFNLESWREDKFTIESDNLYKLHKRWTFFMALVSPVTNVIGAIGISTILFIGLSSVKAGSLTVGEFSSFFVTSILLYDPVKRLGRVATIVQSALGVADRVYQLLDEPTQVEEIARKATAKFSKPVAGALEFKNINFKYDDTQLFNNLNLSIPAKSSLALVGPSGGGKTSLVSLIPRFYEVNSGEILIDGVNTAELSLNDLRKQIAIVTQEPLLFTGTIRENIALGTHNANATDIIKAAQDSFVLEFADKLEQGLDTNIGEAGSKLSIGQKQRISLARAFISKAPIIILDEPTSALDNESQEYIYKSINKLMQDRTVIIIAHRLSTIKSCDRIVYLQGGEIIEAGTHDELLAKDQAYAGLLS